MRCDDVRELLSGYIDGTLDLDEQAWVEEHLRRCRDCASELAALRSTLALVQQLDEVEPPPDFRVQLRRRILAERRKERRGFLARLGPSFAPFRGVVAVAATLVLAVGVGTALQSPAALAWLGLARPAPVVVGQAPDTGALRSAPGVNDSRGKAPDGDQSLLGGGTTALDKAGRLNATGDGTATDQSGKTATADQASNGEGQAGLLTVPPTDGGTTDATGDKGTTGDQADGGQVVATEFDRSAGTTPSTTSSTGTEGTDGAKTIGPAGQSGSLGGPAIDQDILAVLPQKVGKQATLQIEVRNVDEAVTKVTQLAEKDSGKGPGYVESSSTYTDQTGLKHAALIIQVPADTLLDTLTQVEKLGTLMAKNLNGQDVVPDYTDAEARLKVLKQQESRYLEIVARTKAVDEVIRLENELAAVRTKIELLQSRIEEIKASTAYSKVTIDLVQAPAITGAAPPPAGSAGMSAGEEAGQAFILTSRGLGVLAVRAARALGGAAPILLILAFLWFVYYLFVHIRPARVRGRG